MVGCSCIVSVWYAQWCAQWCAQWGGHLKAIHHHHHHHHRPLLNRHLYLILIRISLRLVELTDMILTPHYHISVNLHGCLTADGLQEIRLICTLYCLHLFLLRIYICFQWAPEFITMEFLLLQWSRQLEYGIHLLWNLKLNP